MAPKKIAAGNWKMNGVKTSLSELDQLGAGEGCEVLICPPFTLISLAAGRAGAVQIGAQDCHANASGAHTGDISAPMLKDAGASHVITGHSERRADHGETDAIVAAKTQAAHHAGLVAIVCVGETEAQRDAGDTLDVIATQLAGSVPDGSTAANTVVAYEPVWAIGTGRTPTTDQIAEVHALIRDKLAARFADGADFSLLYGGSVKPGNAAEIFAVPHVNGALVGGASLKASDFNPIIDALSRA
ncbi:triose-phosphate isomerase [Paracoccus xiamenensis]|uniref:triose-phosphate isomerase n=1 Tax=Paracoccus xiamenensis TaxID=2714901 RepID=UPI001408E17B|nr:triose-phosphate isomerase [Paracoccus xiamenensis]NHF72736.1 triose-phosphate isomerase [Paracoccus xiamenensis]